MIALVDPEFGALFDPLLEQGAAGLGNIWCRHPSSLAGSSADRPDQRRTVIDMEQVRFGDHVRAALSADRPVVALESTIIAHGLPRPRNLDVARQIEQTVRDNGAVPATIGVVAGVPVVGLDDDELTRLATSDEVAKLSVRDLAVAAAARADGATTVASTAALAAHAGIALFATGGLGGVHRGAAQTYDESADLVALGRTPVMVVCAGVKSILDVGATLERLETLGVTVVGYGTRRFPGFYLTDSGFDLDWSVSTPDASGRRPAGAAGAGRAPGRDRGGQPAARPTSSSIRSCTTGCCGPAWPDWSGTE